MLYDLIRDKAQKALIAHRIPELIYDYLFQRISDEIASQIMTITLADLQEALTQKKENQDDRTS